MEQKQTKTGLTKAQREWLTFIANATNERKVTVYDSWFSGRELRILKQLVDYGVLDHINGEWSVSANGRMVLAVLREWE